MFLHDAIQQVLRRHGSVPVSVEEIAAEINAEDPNRKIDDSAIAPWQVGARAMKRNGQFRVLVQQRNSRKSME